MSIRNVLLSNKPLPVEISKARSLRRFCKYYSIMPAIPFHGFHSSGLVDAKIPSNAPDKRDFGVQLQRRFANLSESRIKESGKRFPIRWVPGRRCPVWKVACFTHSAIFEVYRNTNLAFIPYMCVALLAEPQMRAADARRAALVSRSGHSQCGHCRAREPGESAVLLYAALKQTIPQRRDSIHAELGSAKEVYACSARQNVLFEHDSVTIGEQLLDNLLFRYDLTVWIEEGPVYLRCNVRKKIGVEEESVETSHA